MQSTYHVPDEMEGLAGRLAPRDLHRFREEVSLAKHQQFAESATAPRTSWCCWPWAQTGSQYPIYTKGSTSAGRGQSTGETVWRNLLTQMRGMEYLWGVWGTEVLLMLFVVMAMTSEMWGSCPYALGLSSSCQYCYSQAFLLWTGGFLLLWVLDLYLFVLLVSRGFRFHLRHAPLTISDNEARGVPLNAIYLFFWLSATLLIWLVGGAIVLTMSRECSYSSSIAVTQQRSPLMFWTTMFNVIFSPLLLFCGRCSDVVGFVDNDDDIPDMQPMVYHDYQSTS